MVEGFDALINSAAVPRLDKREIVQRIFYEVDDKLNLMRALVWRFGATGETKLVARIGQTDTALKEALKRARGLSDEKEFQGAIAALGATAEKFIAANEQSINFEGAKDEVVGRTVKLVNEAGQLIDQAVPFSQKNMQLSKQEYRRLGCKHQPDQPDDRDRGNGRAGRFGSVLLPRHQPSADAPQQPAGQDGGRRPRRRDSRRRPRRRDRRPRQDRHRDPRERRAQGA